MRGFIALFILAQFFTANPIHADGFRTELAADITSDGLIDFVELVENVAPGDADLHIWVRDKESVLNLSSQSVALV